MIKDLQLRLTPEEAYQPEVLRRRVASELALEQSRIKDVVVTRRSIDARQRRVMVNLGVKVVVDSLSAGEQLTIAEPIDFKPLSADAPSAVVVGAGPAGLFAALRLIELGVRPVVLERGKDVDARRKDMALISREGTVNPDSNYCFGEGGAGAFSDGKLYTRSKKRGNVGRILNIFHQHGASADILVDAHPHIGTDQLPEVIKAMRHTIERCGGSVVFGARVERVLLNEGATAVEGVVTSDGKEYRGPVILATGHSARDVYRMLHATGVELQAKGIAVGVRLEHPQKVIDSIMYHNSAGRGRFLPAAEYSLLERVDDRAVYSFCMCPGGFIIPAASEPGQVVVNGMSPSSRGTRWANSGMVVEILPDDLPKEYSEYGPLAVMKYQEDIERRFFAEANESQVIAAQRMKDFVDGRLSAELPRVSYAPGVHSGRVDQLLPRPVSYRLQEGFRRFGKKYRGFLTNEAVVMGPETRTSAPVRIPRLDDTLVHTSVAGLYPCGEGAGYAGGIVSAAIDGERCAEALAATFAK